VDKTIESGLQALEIYHSLSDMNPQGLTYDLLASAYLQLGNFIVLLLVMNGVLNY
jgi:hypothetical protein